MIAKILVDDDPIFLTTTNDVYNVVIDDDTVRVEIHDVIIKEITGGLEDEELYDIEVDTSVANITYVGQAQPGTAGSEAGWRIKRITETSVGSSVDWAGGVASFIYIWNDRLTLTYGP